MEGTRGCVTARAGSVLRVFLRSDLSTGSDHQLTFDAAFTPGRALRLDGSLEQVRPGSWLLSVRRALPNGRAFEVGR